SVRDPREAPDSRKVAQARRGLVARHDRMTHRDGARFDVPFSLLDLIPALGARRTFDPRGSVEVMGIGPASDRERRETIGRLAPSPTGGLHLGHARTFLIAWLVARGGGGRLVLRIEDLDASRVRTEAKTSILDDLRWL